MCIRVIPFIDIQFTTLCFTDAPDVTVVAHNTTTASNWTDLACHANGVPDIYTYITWKHTWPGHKFVLNTYTGNPNLRLNGLTYAHSGIYRCKVTNGVNTSANSGAGVGSTYLAVAGKKIELLFLPII